MTETVKDPALVQAEIDHHQAEAALARKRTELVTLETEWAARQQRDKLAGASENNIYTFLGSVNDMSAAVAMQTLGDWARREPNCDIEIVFDSPGGSVFAGLALYDYIQTIKEAGHKVTTTTVGMAASMGGILLQAGQERIAGRNAFMLIHEVSNGAAGKTSDLEDSLAFTKRPQAKLVDILAERSTLTARQITNKWKKTDWWLSAEEMLELGFIDRIRG